jgi:hypothetical protein
MSPSSAANPDAICPAVPNGYGARRVTPHPVVRNMQRNTYVCYTCKRTRTYMLPGKPEVKADANDAAQRAS